MDISEISSLNEYIQDFINPIWKEVVINNKRTVYEISNVGDIRNIYTGLYLKPSIDKDGYSTISLHTYGFIINTSIHRLVAQAFIPNPDNKPQVNHKNANKSCNWYKNLEWVTAKENIEHARAMGLENHLGLRGEDNIRNIYSEKQIRKACKMMEDPQYAPRDILKATGVDKTTQSLIRKGKNWTHIAKEYNFHHKNFRYGINNNKGKYQDEIVHKICKLLEDTTNNPSKIARMMNIPASYVLNIYNGTIRKEISSQYNIPRRKMSGVGNWVNCKYTVDQIREVCRELQNPYIQYHTIANNTGVDFNTVAAIGKGKQWKEIIIEFPSIPKRVNKKTEIILKLYSQGLSYSEIYNKMKDEFFIGIDLRKGCMQIGGIIRERGLNKK